MLRTHTSKEINLSLENQIVELTGWVHYIRNHGGLLFIDLRDYSGLVQLKFDPNSEIFSQAEQLHQEWVIKVKGKVIKRPEDMINQDMATGEVEIEAEELEILNKCKTLPFEIREEKGDQANESLRLKYRFLDLRRPELQSMLKTKDEFIKHIRQYFQTENFCEIQTPILANSSPEGARDFLVPSRLYPGQAFALPQAPQQFKQLLMVGGVDKYFQIAPCFRDEDPRVDRHYGEFYQLDMEMSFVEQEDVLEIMEPLMKELTEKFSNKKLVNLGENETFKQIPYREAMTKYGSDKPDLRYDLTIEPISEIVKDCEFKVFSEAVKNQGVVHALKVPQASEFSRKDIDDLEAKVKKQGAKGLAYIILEEKEIRSPISKFLSPEIIEEIKQATQAEIGDIIFFAADNWRTVCESLGVVREECGQKLNLKDPGKAAFAWIVDFPMYDYSEIEEGRIDFGHNPFSMPQGGMKALEEKDPLDILAFQFDLVLNGFEVSSGAIRNHSPEIMYKAFKVAGYSKEEVEEKFGGMINAFSYGAPPHGGNAPGIDRLLLVLKEWNSIRDVYAFPKDGQGRDLLMNSPSEMTEAQLKELNIKVEDKDKKE